MVRDRRLFGFKFRRQHIKCGFIVDFYCHELRLVLEIDGSSHAAPERAQYDAARTARLETNGLLVVRLRNDQVSEETLKTLIQSISNRSPSHRSPSPRSGEGVRG